MTTMEEIQHGLKTLALAREVEETSHILSQATWYAAEAEQEMYRLKNIRSTAGAAAMKASSTLDRHLTPDCPGRWF